VAETGPTVTIKTANLSLSATKSTGQLRLLDKTGSVLLNEHGEGIQCGDNGKGYALEMTLSPDEHIFGHGDISGPLDHRTMTNIGMQVEYRPRCVCVPFFMSTAGYGMYVNDSSQKLRFDYFGERTDGYYTASSPDGALDIFLIGGPSLKQIIGNYSSVVVGRAPLVPRYALGVIWSMKAGCDYDYAMSIAKRFRSDDLPVDSLQFEPGPGYAAYIPKAIGKTDKETIQDLTALDYRVAVWSPRYPNFWQDHRDWLGWGLSWIKIDPANRDYKSNSSQDTDALTVMKEFTELSGGRRPFISDCAGSTLAALHPSIRMCDRAGRTSTWQSMMNTAMSGVPYFFCDYWGTKDAGWYPGCTDDHAQSACSRETIPQNLFLPTVNGQSWSYQYMVGYPWEQGAEWENDYRYYAKLRYRLLPYYYSCAADCTLRTGIPMTRPLALEFQNDAKTYAIDSNEFMFGDSLLVAIAYANMNGSRDVYLPAGAKWIDYWSGQEYAGGQSVKLTIPPNGPEHLCGLYVRSGAIIPMGHEITSIDTDTRNPTAHGRQVLLDIYPDSTCTFRMYDDDGTTMRYATGDYCATTMQCQAVGNKVSFTIGPRIGSFKPPTRSYLMKINGRSMPLTVSANGALLTKANSFRNLVDARSGWWYGQGDILINGPEGFTLSARPKTLWIKMPDSGNVINVSVAEPQANG
jgi:alpha-glucosidase (family GH31 glycosyl hydrolase)